jgi:predicted NUDIX family phosphoesterase
VAENVLVVHKELLQEYVSDNENNRLIKRRKLQILNAILENHTFMARNVAEYDYNFKQVIPYVIIRHDKSYLLLKRTSKQTESRLHDKYSLGIGGHINPILTTSSAGDIILHGLFKELNEEVLTEKPGNLEFLGVINDESSSVSRVHLGLVYILELLSSEYKILESEKMSGQWADADELSAYYDMMETWSQIVYDNFVLSKGKYQTQKGSVLPKI